MKKVLLVLFALVLPCLAIANPFKGYEWEQTRTRIPLTEKERALPELILKNHVQYNYGFEGDEFVMHYVVHKIILVNNSEAIQRHNRIVIPMNSVLELVDVRARAINKDGKVILFDKNNLKELKEEGSGNAYRIFAVEGIEVGSEIEYYFIRKMHPYYFDRSMVQMDVPIKDASFRLACPKHLKFDFKLYPLNTPVKFDTLNGENVYSFLLKDIPALEEEPMSYFESNRKRIEFKLAYNVARSQARLYTWDDAGKTFYRLLHNRDKDDEKALERFLKTLNDNPGADLSQRIRNVEQKLKTTIQIEKEGGNKSLSQIAQILKLKVGSHEGMTKLTLAIFEALGIETHVVMTCDRRKAKFDGSFDSWSYLDEYLLYFPETKGYLAPYSEDMRYPLVPFEFTAQKGIFIEPLTVGGMTSGLASVQEITPSDYRLSFDKMNLDVRFTPDVSGNEITLNHRFGGYNASFITPYYQLMTDDKRKQLVEELVKGIAPDQKIGKWSAYVRDSAANEFGIDVEFLSSHFLERAGPRILFKAGLLIGPQMEMYRDDKRVTDVENNFNRSYNRILRIHIPAGYTVKNPDDLKFNVVYEDGNKAPFKFISEYELAGNVLTVRIIEDYEEIYAPLSRYEDFRKVINASADFNKVTLVLEKK